MEHLLKNKTKLKACFFLQAGKKNSIYWKDSVITLNYEIFLDQLIFSVAENSHLTAKAAAIKTGAARNQTHTTEVGKIRESPIIPPAAFMLPCTNEFSSHCTSPVCFMKFHNLLFKLFSLVWGQFKFTDIICAVQIRVIVSQFGLHRVRAQQSQSRKGTRQPPRNDVLSKLKTQVIPLRNKNEKSSLQRTQ